MISFFFNVLVVAIQLSETTPPPPPPPPPAGQLPIDGGVWLLLLFGVLFGVWSIYKRRQSINKAS